LNFYGYDQGDTLMKIAIFGGTGRTGMFLVRFALDQGHQVVVLARDPTKMTLIHPSLNTLPGDVRDVAAVEQTVQGVDAVISVLGPAGNKPGLEISQGTGHILAAMQKQALRRLVITAGAGVSDPSDAPELFNRAMNLLLKLVAKNVLADMIATVDRVRVSDLDWTVVRLPMLSDGSKTGRIKVGYVGKGIGPRITRADIAEFLLVQLKDVTYIHQCPVISN
jgi:putative NADH-flavin reductase